MKLHALAVVVGALLGLMTSMMSALTVSASVALGITSALLLTTVVSR